MDSTPTQGEGGPKSAEPPAMIDALAETFRVLGDPTRLRIAVALTSGEHTVTSLAASLGMSHSAVSHSLQALRRLRLVRVRRDGRAAFYALDDEHIARLLEDGLEHIREGS